MHVVQRRAERDQRAEEMVNDVLDVSRVEQGLMTLQLEPLAIVPFVRDIVPASARTVPRHLRTKPEWFTGGAWRFVPEETFENGTAAAS